MCRSKCSWLSMSFVRQPTDTTGNVRVYHQDDCNSKPANGKFKFSVQGKFNLLESMRRQFGKLQCTFGCLQPRQSDGNWTRNRSYDLLVVEAKAIHETLALICMFQLFVSHNIWNFRGDCVHLSQCSNFPKLSPFVSSEIDIMNHEPFRWYTSLSTCWCTEEYSPEIDRQ
jgi:hypothetical protein